MASTRERIFASAGAILFFVAASATTIFVVWAVHQQDKSTSTSTACTAASSSQKTTLEGTKLQNFSPIASVPELKIIDTKVGKGTEAKAGDSVCVDYTGAVAATGVIFQSSLDSGQPVTLSLSQVIDGWKNGIPGMRVGGERRLLIPAAQAYGANPPSGSGIPANADLVFDIVLHSIGS